MNVKFVMAVVITALAAPAVAHAQGITRARIEGESLGT
jgi:hypothetical protein